MATRIKDGVFMADGETSQDAEFISLNKVGYIVNCAGRQLPNLWARQGVRYLTFPWDDAEDCALFDAHDARCCVRQRPDARPNARRRPNARIQVVVEQLVSFIDEALRSGDSVVVHSHLGTGRCVAACAAYLMHKYEWGSDKAMRYVRSKRGDAQPNAGFLRQLRALDRRFQAARTRQLQLLPLPKRRLALAWAKRRLAEWDAALPFAGDTDGADDEAVLINSFENSKPDAAGAAALTAPLAPSQAHAATRLRWVDEGAAPRAARRPLTSCNTDDDDDARSDDGADDRPQHLAGAYRRRAAQRNDRAAPRSILKMPAREALKARQNLEAQQQEQRQQQQLDASFRLGLSFQQFQLRVRLQPEARSDTDGGSAQFRPPARGPGRAPPVARDSRQAAAWDGSDGSSSNSAPPPGGTSDSAPRGRAAARPRAAPSPQASRASGGHRAAAERRAEAAAARANAPPRGAAASALSRQPSDLARHEARELRRERPRRAPFDAAASSGTAAFIDSYDFPEFSHDMTNDLAAAAAAAYSQPPYVQPPPRRATVDAPRTRPTSASEASRRLPFSQGPAPQPVARRRPLPGGRSSTVRASPRRRWPDETTLPTKSLSASAPLSLSVDDLVARGRGNYAAPRAARPASASARPASASARPASARPDDRHDRWAQPAPPTKETFYSSQKFPAPQQRGQGYF